MGGRHSWHDHRQLSAAPYNEATTMTAAAPAPATRIRRRATAVIAAALLLLLGAQPVLAVEWGPAIRLS